MKLRALACALGLTLATPAAADNFCDLLDINPFGGCGYWTLYGDALYMKPDNSDFPWVKFPLGDPEDAMIRSLVPDYHWGFRVGLDYTSPSGCSFMELSGTYLWGRDSASEAGDSLIANFQNFGRTVVSAVQAKYRFDYWNVDLRLGRQVWRGGGLLFHVAAGGRYVFVDETPRQMVPPGENSIDGFDISYRWAGAGPQLGAGAEFSICNGLTVRGRLSGMAIVGARRTHVVTVSEADGFSRVCFDRATIIAPGLDLRLSLSYSQELLCMLWGAELGWQLDHYWNSVARFNLFSNPNNVVQRELSDVGYSGPYLSFSVGF